MGQSLITKAEVAELLGRSTRWVELNADRFRPRPMARAANGRVVLGYDLGALPAAAQLAWAARQKVVEIAPAPAPAEGQLVLGLAAPAGPNLSEEGRAQAERRYRVIEPLLQEDARRNLCAQFGGMAGAVAWLAEQNQTKPRTVYHWLQAFKRHGLPGLVRRGRADKGTPRRLNTAALEFVRTAALPRKGAYGELSAREIHRAYCEERAWRAAHVGQALGEFERAKYARYVDERGRLSPAALLPEASYECLREWLARIPEVVRVLAREGREAWHNTQGIISWRAIGEVKPLDYVVMDHRRLDLFGMIRERGGWRLARPWLTAAIDMRTRRWLAWAIVETPSSDSIATVLRKMFVVHGLPVSLYWDNGKDFTCEWFEGRTPRSRKAGAVRELAPAMRGVLETLGVRVHHAIVRNARAKLIEPNFLNTANFDRTLPWWCGHKPGARPDAFGELLTDHERWLAGERSEQVFPTFEEVAALYSNLLDELNAREHTGEGMGKITPTGKGWMSPNECWEREIGRVEKRTVSPEVLQFSFAKRRQLTVRHGEVQTTFDRRDYHYRLMGSEVGLMAWNGREVELAYDPLDLGTAAVYCEGRLLGLAHCVELRRMGEREFVADEKARRAALREVRRAIAAAHGAVYVPDARARAARRVEVLPAPLEPVRPEIPAVLPAALVETVEAARAEGEFSFASSAAAVEVSEPAETGGDEFHFFQE